LGFRLGIRGKSIGFEIKRTADPKVTKSTGIAVKDLGIQLQVVDDVGPLRFQLAPDIGAILTLELLNGQTGLEVGGGA